MHTIAQLCVLLFMAALWNRVGHYIFALWFLSFFFISSSFFLLLSFFFFLPRLISASQIVFMPVVDILNIPCDSQFVFSALDELNFSHHA